MSEWNAGHEETAAAWNVVARAKYQAEFDQHVAVLKAGGNNLLPEEAEILADLLPGSDVVHLQCSHGFDALGLLNAGARSVVGVDISEVMVAQARAKAEAVGAASAAFVCSDVLSPSLELDRTADLVYTGRGSLPWILDIDHWASAVFRILRPGGTLFIFEGHPLASLWDRSSARLQLRPGAGYFDSAPSENPGFPASVVEGAMGADRPRMIERQWQPGEVIGALVDQGLRVTRFREFPTLFWDQFPEWQEQLRYRLPNSYALLAQRS